MPIVKCQVCDVDFRVDQNVLNIGKGKYCSRPCFMRGRKKPKRLLCETCGKTFETYPYLLKQGYGKYCSTQCSTKAKTTRFEKKCLYCGNRFMVEPNQITSGRGKYCSRDCSFGEARNLAEQKKIERAASNKERRGLAVIYCLLTSRNTPLYIGKTMPGREQQRLNEHFKEGPCSHYYSLKMVTIEVVPASIWREREKYWLRYYEEQGYKMFNRIDAGGGGWSENGRASRECINCNKSFMFPKYQIKHRKYCSKSCMTIHKSTFPTRPCEYCGNEIIVTYKTRKKCFCSSYCSRKSRHIPRPDQSFAQSTGDISK